MGFNTLKSDKEEDEDGLDKSNSSSTNGIDDDNMGHPVTDADKVML